MTSACGQRPSTARALRSASIATAARVVVPDGTVSSTPGVSARNGMPRPVISARREGEVEASTSSEYRPFRCALTKGEYIVALIHAGYRGWCSEAPLAHQA